MAPIGVVAVSVVLVSRILVTPPTIVRDDIRIVSVDRRRAMITLIATTDSVLPGRYGFWFSIDSGHARLGEVLSRTHDTVTRRLLGVDFGDIRRADAGRLSGWVHLTPRALGVPFSDVVVATTVGPAPAWLIPTPPTRTTTAAATTTAAIATATPATPESTAIPGGPWVIQVHGRGVRRSEPLRAVEVFRDAGYTSLVISWRNDGDAPRSEDGRYALGGTEWLDVDAALGFALAHGATEIVLMGWSMGGAMVLQAATRSPHAAVISGIVLESPVVDWAPTILHQARLMHVPRIVRRGVLGMLAAPGWHRLAGTSAPIDFVALDFVTRADELDVPVLILHSDDDGFVPTTASRELAEARPDLVTYQPWRVARHTKLWNYDPERFTAEIGSWLRTLRDG